MGNTIAFIQHWGEELPPTGAAPTYDPFYGFPEGRKQRVIQATEEEMNAAKVPPELRDYCVDYYLKILECKRVHYPFMYKCAAQVHGHQACEYEDYVLRKKEYERERRLLNRKKANAVANAA